MGEYLDQVPAAIQGHLQKIAKDAQVEEGEDPVEKVAQAWIEKQNVFEEKIEEMNMEEVDFLAGDDEQGALALTYSGSLVNIGPLIEGKRHCTYTSIGFRTGTPEAAEKEDSVLAKDASVDDVIAFDPGPVKSTSNIFKIAVCKDDLSAEEQQENVTRAATIIEEEFVEVNKTVMM